MRSRPVETENVLWKLAVDSFREGLVVMELIRNRPQKNPDSSNMNIDSDMTGDSFCQIVIIQVNQGFLSMTGMGQSRIGSFTQHGFASY